MAAMDPLKVFLGQLRNDINKPHVKEWLDRHGIRGVRNIYMVKPETGPQCCFVKFGNIEDAQNLTFLHGDEDTAVTETRIQASIIVTQHGSS